MCADETFPPPPPPYKPLPVLDFDREVKNAKSTQEGIDAIKKHMKAVHEWMKDDPMGEELRYIRSLREAPYPQVSTAINGTPVQKAIAIGALGAFFGGLYWLYRLDEKNVKAKKEQGPQSWQDKEIARRANKQENERSL